MFKVVPMTRSRTSSVASRVARRICPSARGRDSYAF